MVCFRFVARTVIVSFSLVCMRAREQLFIRTGMVAANSLSFPHSGHRRNHRRPRPFTTSLWRAKTQPVVPWLAQWVGSRAISSYVKEVRLDLRSAEACTVRLLEDMIRVRTSYRTRVRRHHARVSRSVTSVNNTVAARSCLSFCTSKVSTEAETMCLQQERHQTWNVLVTRFGTSRWEQ